MEEAEKERHASIVSGNDKIYKNSKQLLDGWMDLTDREPLQMDCNCR